MWVIKLVRGSVVVAWVGWRVPMRSWCAWGRPPAGSPPSCCVSASRVGCQRAASLSWRVLASLGRDHQRVAHPLAVFPRQGVGRQRAAFPS